MWTECAFTESSAYCEVESLIESLSIGARVCLLLLLPCCLTLGVYLGRGS